MLLPTVTIVLFQSNVATKLITNSGNEETGENFKAHISKLVLEKKKICSRLGVELGQVIWNLLVSWKPRKLHIPGKKNELNEVTCMRTF